MPTPPPWPIWRRTRSKPCWRADHAQAFGLDEYIGLSPTHPQTYRTVLEQAIVSRVDLAPTR